MAFKMRGTPMQRNFGLGDDSALPKRTKFEKEKKYRTDVVEHKSGGTTHSFTRGGRFKSKPTGRKNEAGDEYLDVKDNSYNKPGDNIADQRKDSDSQEKGRSVSIRVSGGGDTYYRDAQRINRKGERKTGIFKPKAITKRRYDRIMNRKKNKQIRKDTQWDKKTPDAKF